jgi:hypothetical protein
MDSAKGTEDDEARLRYEQRAVLRAQAIREKKSVAGKKVEQETPHATPSADYMTWRSARVEEMMSSQAGAYATDHSTIMTNPMHAERVLAYDVPVGVCRIKAQALRRLRVAADWRLLKALDETNASKVFMEYFDKGEFRKKAVAVWASQSDEAAMPNLIIDKRQNPALNAKPDSGEMAHG